MFRLWDYKYFGNVRFRLWGYKYFFGKRKLHKLARGFEDTLRQFSDRFSCGVYCGNSGLKYIESAPEGLVTHQFLIPHNVTVRQLREAIEKSVNHNYLYDLLKGQKEV